MMAIATVICILVFVTVLLYLDRRTRREMGQTHK